MKNRLLIASLFFMVSLHVTARVSVGDLTVDDLQDPIAIDAERPEFAWKLQSDMHSTFQTAYEIKVGMERNSSAIDWRSTGKIMSAASTGVAVDGLKLQSATSYVWQVRVWDNYGNVSDWSYPAHFGAGLLQSSDWQAQWITYPWQEDTQRSQPSPMLRKPFVLHGGIAWARLYITALGLYEAHINGHRVSDAYFAPGWTSYDKRLQYQVYDVADLLREGDNVLGAVLGDGWYRGVMTFANQRNLYGDRLALRAELRIAYEDGRHQSIVSDNSWLAGTGEIRASDIYNGEMQDLRLRQAGWSAAGFAAQGWRPATIYTGTTPRLVASAAQPVRSMESVRPLAVLRGPHGETILDMGQNMVGWMRVQAHGQAGQRITLHHAEVLDPQGALYLQALRGAAQRVDYILPDDKLHTLEPHFSFQGFRYVQVDGYPGAIDPKDFTGIVLHSDLPQTGHFETSDPMLNRLQANIEWGQKGNFLDVPTDCPQRDERLGWTGDIQVFAATAAFNRDSAAFLRKWLADVQLDQFADGGVPFVVPDALSRLHVHSFSSLFLRMKNSASGWGDAIAIVPRVLYDHYGDRAAIEQLYEGMRRWVEYERAAAASPFFTWIDYRNWFDSQRRADDRFIWNGSFTFGDWLAPVPVSNEFVNTVYFANSAQLVSEAAHILGKADDETTYAKLAAGTRRAFQRRFMRGDGRMMEDVQGAYVLALQYDMLEPALRPGAARRLNELVQADGTHLATGFLSTPHLLGVLSRYGYMDTAYALLQQQTYPSWLYPITKGATTIWERWGSIQPDGSFGDDGMNSFNHYAYGAVGDWMYRNIGGIAPLQPGYKEIGVAPVPGGNLTHASARLESPYGRIEVAWQRKEGGLQTNIEVPVNTRARFVFPAAGARVLRDGQPLRIADGVEDIAVDAQGRTVLMLGSGSYSFRDE